MSISFEQLIKEADQASNLPELGSLLRLKLKGTGLVQPLGIGPALRIDIQEIEVTHKEITPEEVNHEVGRIEGAVTASIEQLNLLQRKHKDHRAASVVPILKTQSTMIESLPSPISSKIKSELITAETAVDLMLKDFYERLAANGKHGERMLNDIRDIRHRVLKNLEAAEYQIEDTSDAAQVVVVAEKLTTSQAASLDPLQVSAVATVKNGVNDHVKIILEAMGIPYVTGLDPEILAVNAKDTIAVDGFTGNVFINPPDEVLHELSTSLEHYQVTVTKKSLHDAPSKTYDNKKISIFANAQGLDSAREGHRLGVKGIGLYRTEFLFLNRGEPPSEDEQYDNFTAVLLALDKDQPFVIRTIDFGADKMPEWGETPSNKGLLDGVRGIRFSMCDENNMAIFKEHVRAILRAALIKPDQVKIMFPMINDVEEFESALKVVNDEMAGLARSGNKLPKVQIGSMIETPASVTCVESILEVADFVSIGTNDLTEYELVVPRTHSLYGHAYNEAHPVVLGAIRKVMDCAKKVGKPASVCGAMASNPLKIPLLLGAGVRDFSVSPNRVEEVNGILKLCSVAECENLVNKIIDSRRPTLARQMWENYLEVLKERAADIQSKH